MTERSAVALAFVSELASAWLASFAELFGGRLESERSAPARPPTDARTGRRRAAATTSTEHRSGAAPDG